MDRCFHTALPLALLIMCIGGCFREPALEACEDDKGCTDPAFPVCSDGYCFHHTFAYLMPVCSLDREPSKPGCCGLAGDNFKEDAECELWTVSHPDAAISAPTTAPGGRFAYTFVKDGELVLRSTSFLNDSSWERTLSAIPEGPSPMPAVNSEGDIAVAAGNAVYVFDAAGDSPSWTDEGRYSVGDDVLGLPAFCSSGDLYVVQDSPGENPAEQIRVLRLWRAGEKAGECELAVGTLPEQMGPVVYEKGGRVAVPVVEEEDSYVAVFSSNGGGLDKKWELKSGETGGEFTGLALDHQGVLVAAWKSGMWKAIRLAAETPEDTEWYSVTSDVIEGSLLSGPVMLEDGEAFLAAAMGGLYRVGKGTKHHVVATVPSLLLSRFSPLRQSGFVGVSPRAESEALVFAVDGATLPGGGAEAGRKELLWDGGCKELRFSIPVKEGVMAVVCDDRVFGIVAPDYVPASAPWPSPRGPGNSGCR